MSDETALTEGELALLRDAEIDDVHTVSMLFDLGLIESTKDRPTPDAVSAAFESLARLLDLGLIRVGRLENSDGGPDGRLAPVRHVAEPLDVVHARVTTAIAAAQEPSDWWFASWVVAT
ncbi:hypothetical protein [Herbiconiux sp.]|jgi:hypothetical protein|uniref:hypothetical protein n=1 Tax=Herbiconiux sp. TaxID=1871186 RepID=UPI0025C67921|nr:hypothetical protein [Herbiconiux sp.]